MIQRPKNLNLLTIHFPLPAIVSILHRISGLVLFILTPFVLWVWGLSISVPEVFDHIQYILQSFFVKGIIWLLLLPFCYHFVAGIRHLFLDIHIGEELRSGRITAIYTLFITAVLAVLIGVWLW